MGNSSTTSISQSNARSDVNNSEEDFDVIYNYGGTSHNFGPYNHNSHTVPVAILQDFTHFKLLIESQRLSVNGIDLYGNTPLHIAVLEQKIMCFDYLLEAQGIKINIRNNFGETPLIFASKLENSYFVAQLLEKGANFNLTNNSQSTALHYAAYKGCSEVCKTLIECGININSENMFGETSLYLACKNGKWSIIYMLLYYGGDVMSPSLDSFLPLTILQNGADDDLKQILFNHTFDSLENAIQLKILTNAMLKNSSTVPDIIEKVSNLAYNARDLKYLSDNLLEISPKHFVLFLNKFQDVAKEMFVQNCTLTNYLTTVEAFRNIAPDFEQFLYILLESPLSYHVIQSCCYSISPISTVIKIFYKRKLSLKKLTDLVCFMLSYGVNLNCDDLNAVYVFYGYCELFKILLHMDLKMKDSVNGESCCTLYNFEVVQKSVMPNFIYDVNLTVDSFLEDPNNYLLMNLDVLLHYFANSKIVKFFRDSGLVTSQMFDKSTKLPKVPYLVQLSRDAARSYIIKRYDVKTSQQFYTILHFLPISNVYKMILSFEKKIYNI